MQLLTTQYHTLSTFPSRNHPPHPGQLLKLYSEHDINMVSNIPLASVVLIQKPKTKQRTSLSGQERWCVMLDWCTLHAELVAGVFGVAYTHSLQVGDVDLEEVARHQLLKPVQVPSLLEITNSTNDTVEADNTPSKSTIALRNNFAFQKWVIKTEDKDWQIPYLKGTSGDTISIGCRIENHTQYLKSHSRLALQFKIEIQQPSVPTRPPIKLSPRIYTTGPYIIKNIGQQQVLFNPSWSLKRVELALQIDVSEIKPDCSAFLRVAHTGWSAWLHGRSLKQSQRTQRDATGLLGTGLGILNTIDAEVLVNKLTATTEDLIKLEHPLKSSLSALGASQWLLSDILPHWERIEENDHQLIAKALGATQSNTSLALSCIQAQLWIQSIVAAIIREGEGGTLPTEIRKLIWDNASEFEREFQSWWQLVNFTHYTEGDKIIAFVLTIRNASVYNIYPILALGLNHNGNVLYPLEHKVWAHQKEGKWQTIDVNACTVREQRGFICEGNTLEAQDICLDTEQNICHFEIHPNETPETVVIYVGKGCVCMRTRCDSLLIDGTVHNITNKSNLCVCNFSVIIGCDFHFSVPITTYDDLSFNYMLYHELQPTPIGMSLTIIEQLLQHPDLIDLLQQAQKTGQKTLITVQHDIEEIHQVLTRVKRDGEHQWWESLFGWSPTATGLFNSMFHPVMIFLILILICLLLIIVLYIKVEYSGPLILYIPNSKTPEVGLGSPLVISARDSRLVVAQGPT
ncbi:uncharacterized protein LOC141917846 [Strix aluco]|uniref:uncharacterized protein LOC141917846 n=1 Tax=Strix aluco TaxID=111821 RepID=UPI003DA4B64C